MPLSRQLPAQGADNKTIAAALEISTAAEHKTGRQIMDKLGKAFPKCSLKPRSSKSGQKKVSALRLFLDEHISPDVAVGFRKRHSAAVIHSVLFWDAGSLAGCPDHLLLKRLFDIEGSLVTCDQLTIVPLLKTWAEQSIDHAGVIFIDERTIAPDDFGGIVRALFSGLGK